jgi:hypothetical protein
MQGEERRRPVRGVRRAARVRRRVRAPARAQPASHQHHLVYNVEFMIYFLKYFDHGCRSIREKSKKKKSSVPGG